MLRANAQLTGFILVVSSKAVYKWTYLCRPIWKNIFYHNWYINPGSSVITLLKIGLRLYNRPRIANTRRLMLIILVPVWGRSPQEAEAKY